MTALETEATRSRRISRPFQPGKAGWRVLVRQPQQMINAQNRAPALLRFGVGVVLLLASVSSEAFDTIYVQFQVADDTADACWVYAHGTFTTSCSGTGTGYNAAGNTVCNPPASGCISIAYAYDPSNFSLLSATVNNYPYACCSSCGDTTVSFNTNETPHSITIPIHVFKDANGSCVYAPPGPPDPPDPPPSCGKDGGQPSCCGGMPVWSVSEPTISLWVQDEPLGYQPAKGPRISLHLGYKQRETLSGMDTNIFSFGKKWNCSWLSYVTNSVNGTNFLLFPGGGFRAFSNGQDIVTSSKISGDTNSGFTISYPDGSKDVYGFVVTNAGGSFLKAFMTERWNANSQKTTLNYLSYDNTKPVIRLDSVVDADGRTNRLYYNSSSAYSTNLVTHVVDAYGRTNSLGYDNAGHLTNSIDVAGISSSFGYDSHDSLTNMTTPYGSTGFQVTEPLLNALTGRSVLITQPDGGHQLYLYQDLAPGVASSYGTIPSTSPFSNTFETSGLDQRNTFFWGPRQYANLSTTTITNFTMYDFRKARMKHWLWASGAEVSKFVSLERDPSPDNDGTGEGQKTWYDYAGKTSSQYQGTQGLPLFVARVLPDGNTSFTRTARNTFGAVTNEVSTFSVGASQLLRTNIYVYSADGVDMLIATNALGVMTASNVYNSFHQVATNYNALGEPTVFTYDSNELLTSVTRASGLVTTNGYDASSGLLLSTYDYAIVGGSPVFYRTNAYMYTNALVFSHTDERNLTTTNIWDGLQRLRKTVFPDGSYASDNYAALDLTDVRDRMGNWTHFGYDSMRRKIAETNSLGFYSTFSYCTCGSLDSMTDAGNNSTFYYYDNQGRLTNVAYADGFKVTNRFDLLGRVTNTADSSGLSATNFYNNQGLLVCSSNAFAQGQAVIYDGLDRATNATDANGVSVKTVLDNLNRPVTRTYPDSGVEQFGYSFGVSSITSYTNQIGSVTRYAYDSLNRKTAETNANLEVTQFGFSPAGDLISLTDGKLQTTTWKYDEYGRTTNKVDAASNVIFKYQYDANGRLTNRWTPAKGNTAYTYDPIGNLTNIHYAVSSNIAMAYDMLNRMTNMVDGVGTSRYSYDGVGQLLSEDGPWASDTVSYAYTNRLRIALSLQQPGGGAWTNGYKYDQIRRLTNVTSPAGSFGYQYVPGTPSTLVQKLSLPNTSVITNAYDSVARMLSTSLRNSSGGLLDYHGYVVDPANQRTQHVFKAGNFENYSYDPSGQLIGAVGKEPGGATNRRNEQFGYFYDAAGNLNRRTNNALIETFNVNNLNELTTQTNSGTFTVAGGTTTPATNVAVNGFNADLYVDNAFARSGFPILAGLNSYTAIARDSRGFADTNFVTVNLAVTNTFVYDLNGNLRTNRTRIFDYDDENELIAITEPNAWRSEFSYDGKMRRRVRKEYTWAGGAWSLTNQVLYVYDGILVIQERDGSDTPQVTYTRGRDLSGSLQGAGGTAGLLGRYDPRSSMAQAAFYFIDGEGNVVALTTTNQLIAAWYRFSPFGGEQVASGPLSGANCYRAFCREFDTKSGLYHFAYRAYLSAIQRWTTRDPISEGGGINLYRFVANDAVNRFDSLGLTCCPDDIEREKQKMIQRYQTGSEIYAAKCIPHGGSGSYSCDSVNYPLLNFISKGISCWNCTEQQRSKYISGWVPIIGNQFFDHWVVICTAADKSGTQILFDYWGNRPPGEDPNNWFYNHYPIPGHPDTNPNSWSHLPNPSGPFPQDSPPPAAPLPPVGPFHGGSRY